MRTSKSVRNNVFGRLTLDQMIVAIIALSIVVGFLKFAIATNGMIRLGCFIIALAILLLYIGFFMKESVLYNSLALIRYGFDYANGGTEITKHSCSTAYLKKNARLPIEGIRERGIIEFSEKQYGLLLRLHPPRRNDQLQAYINRLKMVVDSIPDGIMLKTHTFSVIEAKHPLIDQIRTAIIDKGTSKEKKKYLHSQHTAARNQPPTIGWMSYGVIGFGKHKKMDAVIAVYDTQAAGVMKALADAGIHGDIIDDEYDILLAYRQMLSMRRVY